MIGAQAGSTVRKGAIAAVIFMLGTGLAGAQDMEPRAFSASPIDTNFLIGSYQRTTGDVALDADLPIRDVKAAINTGILAYNRTFDLFGHTGSVAIVLPYLGIAVVVPTGEYNPQQLINISSHRWAFRPEIGGSQPIGNWFVEGSAGVWMFTDNTNFFGGHVRGQDPIGTFQAHVGYNFAPNFWLAADATYYLGGRTNLDGVAGHDFQSVTRAGFTLSIPLGDGFSAKVSFGGWLTAQNAGAFDRIGVTLQYRWFDR